MDLKVAEWALPLVAKKAIDVAFESLKPLLERFKSQLSTTSSEVEKAISDHQRDVGVWASEVSFADFPKGRITADIFVPLDIHLNQIRLRFDGETLPEVPLEDALSQEEQSCIILGMPGAGKTTALKHICHRFLTEETFLDRFSIIIRIQLRDLNMVSALVAPEYLSRYLQELLHFRFAFPADLAGDENAGGRRAIRDRVVIDWLNASRALLILDGFDEVTLKARRDLTIEEIRRLAPQLSTASFVLTGRSGEFNYHVEKVQTFEIKALNDAQIRLFAERWLGCIDASIFINQLKRSPFWDTAIRPLTLVHLCVIFHRIKRIPEKPKTVYRKLVRLLLEKWDEERSVVRESAYANFAADRKAEFLENLSYELTSTLKTTSFDRDGLIRCFSVMHENFGLPKSDATKVIDELQTHTGLFYQSGRERFEFSHKSLQEFLAAEYLVKLPAIPRNMVELQTMPNELAIATAISSRPSEYLSELVVQHFHGFSLSFQFTRAFVGRLLLEAPDFETTPRVGFALLALYSQYLSACVREEDQLSLFVMDQLGEDFGSLASKIKQRVSFEELEFAFETVETAHTFDGDPVLKLTRKRKLQGTLRSSAEGLLPNDVWVRESLLAKPMTGFLAEPTSANGLTLT